MSVPPYTRKRDSITGKSFTKSDEASKIARSIETPWNRCLALASVAYHCDDLAKKNRLLREAFDAGAEMKEPNRIVTVSAWPLKALCKSGQEGKLKGEVNRLLAILATEPSPVRRADALNMMLGAVVSGPRSLFWEVFTPFEQACLMPLLNGKRNVKGEARLAFWLVVVDRFAPERAQELLAAIRGPVLHANAEKWMQEYRTIDLEKWCSQPNLT